MTSLGQAMEIAVIRRDIRDIIERLERILGAERAFPITAPLAAAYEALRGGE